MPMRVFDHFDISAGEKCPICLNDDDGAMVLMPIPGTREGNTCEARQVHLVCIWQWWDFLEQHGFDESPVEKGS